MSQATQPPNPEPAPADTNTNRLQTCPNGAAEAPPVPLSQEEANELQECEVIISRGWTTLLDVGRALARIRTKRLYRGTHSTFEEYCREKFQFSKTHANRLIGAVEVAEVLTPVGVKIQNEFQARHLVGLAPEKILAGEAQAGAQLDCPG